MTSPFWTAGLVSVSLIAAAMPSHAGGLQVLPVADETVRKECGACHMVYAPGLLPARSWTRMIDGLDQHFGDNAALDAAARRRIADYLTANAADARRGDTTVLRGLKASVTPDRITELPWWTRKHERKDRVAPHALEAKGAKFKGDCIACHKQADQGRFDEDD